jgi:hypothetical protein
VRRNAKHKRLHEPPEVAAPVRPTAIPTKTSRTDPANQHSPERGYGCAQREPDADFPDSERNDIADHAVDTDKFQKQRHAGSHAEKKERQCCTFQGAIVVVGVSNRCAPMVCSA